MAAIRNLKNYLEKFVIKIEPLKHPENEKRGQGPPGASTARSGQEPPGARGRQGRAQAAPGNTENTRNTQRKCEF